MLTRVWNEAKPITDRIAELQAELQVQVDLLEPYQRKRDRIMGLMHGPITDEQITKAFQSNALFRILKGKH